MTAATSITVRALSSSLEPMKSSRLLESFFVWNSVCDMSTYWQNEQTKGACQGYRPALLLWKVHSTPGSALGTGRSKSPC